MKITRTFLLSAFFILFLTSCAAKSNKSIVVVLLPGADGKTGQIVVSNQGGSQLIRDPAQATEVRSSDIAPSAPFAMNEATVRKDFGDALSVLPSPPLHFILYFHTGTTIITEVSRKLLAEIMPALKSHKTTAVSIVGHTDRVGTRKKNYQLGLNRALEIKQLLISLGIDPSIIEVTSHGEDNPLIKTMDEVSEPRNRRVEVILR